MIHYSKKSKKNMKVTPEELYKQFFKLALPENDATNVVSIDGTCHKLGKTKEGYPEFYINSDGKEGHPKSTQLEYLDVCYDSPCSICEDGVTKQQCLSVISLRRTGDSLHLYFITIVLRIIENLPSIPTSRKLAVEFDSLISIFSPSHKYDENKAKGLWGELLVIEQSQMPEMLIDAWHINANDKFDFTMGKDKIEVKSTASEERKHIFSIGQLNPSKNSNLVIASIIVRPSALSDTGLSIKDLYDKLQVKIHSTQTKLKLLKGIASIIGIESNAFYSLAFDYATACDTLQFYEASTIPHIDSVSVPFGVSEVSFTSDLKGIECLSCESQIVKESSLYKSLF